MMRVSPLGSLVQPPNALMHASHMYMASLQTYITRRHTSSRVLFVGGMSCKVREEDLRATFEPHGKILEVRINLDPRSKLSRGYGFIKYATVKEAEAALKLTNGQVIHGSRIRVAYAVSEPERGE